MAHDLGAAAADWLQRLVRIPSVNPAHAGPRAGVASERAIADAVGGWLDDLGADWVEVAEDPDRPDRPNVYGCFPGTSDRWVALDVHLDTVGVEQMTIDPFGGDIADGRVWGRGAVDTKGALAAMFACLEERDRPPTPNLLVIGTASEESPGLTGAVALRRWLQARDLVLDELVVAEPTGCSPVYGHKGGLGLELTVRGVAAHSSRPDLGANAIYGAAAVALALRDEHERLQAATPGTAIGNGSLAVTVVDGGLSRNTIPDVCTLYAGRRLVPGEEPEAVAAQVLGLARSATDLEVELHVTHGMRAVHRDPASELCQRFSGWVAQPPTVSTLGTNAYEYPEAVARELIVFGPGEVAQAHSVDEWCAVDQLATAAGAFEHWLET